MFGALRRLAIGSLMSVTVGASLLGNAAPAAAAVHGMGTGYQANVHCDSAGGLISIEASASAAPGFNNGQLIAYQYWVYDETAKRPVAGLDPTTFGTFNHTRNQGNATISFTVERAYSGLFYYVLTQGHAYTVWTDYQFWTGSRWVDYGWVRTTSYYNLNSGASSFCLM